MKRRGGSQSMQVCMNFASLQGLAASSYGQRSEISKPQKANGQVAQAEGYGRVGSHEKGQMGVTHSGHRII